MYLFGKFFNYIFAAHIDRRILQIIWPQSKLRDQNILSHENVEL